MLVEGMLRFRSSHRQLLCVPGDLWVPPVPECRNRYDVFSTYPFFTNFMTRLTTLSLCVLLLATVFGCSDPYPGRSNVTGTITVNGEPIEQGSIAFNAINPPAGVDITGAQVTISNGKYSVIDGSGLLVGDYRVAIRAQQAFHKGTGKMIPNTEPLEGVPHEVRDLVPAKYNTNSEIIFKIEKRGAKTFDFDVKTE